MNSKNSNQLEKKHRWIRDEVVIDFPLPQEIQYLIADLEKLDEEENYGYCNYSESLDYVVRNCWLDKKITKEQGNVICWKYSSIF